MTAPAPLPSCVIVAEHASLSMGGEAAIPWHYFRVLRARGALVHLVVHERVRDELDAIVTPGDEHLLHYTRDTWAHRFLCRAGEHIPARLAYFTLGFAMRTMTQLEARRIARRLVAAEGIDVVHQPIPISPREPSLMHRMGAPVVIGPMNGGMSYPPGIGGDRRPARQLLERLGVVGAAVLHRLAPGKRKAAALLVANERTRRALPFRRDEAVLVVAENGVDLDKWSPVDAEPSTDGAVEFVFLGRLIALKAVDVLIDALARVADELADRGIDTRLTVVGDGPERAALEQAATAARSQRGEPIAQRVAFTGWQTQERCIELLGGADVFVMPSVHDAGGTVVIEAMALSKPVIATAWGGPGDYLDASCGVLVEPDSREALVAGFASAMLDLASDAERRAELGREGRRRVEAEYDWDVMVDRVIEVYRQAMRDEPQGAAV